MEIIEAINKRRSIRKYTKKKISKSILEKILKAAMQAPSANNKQPWQFIVIDSEDILEKI